MEPEDTEAERRKLEEEFFGPAPRNTLGRQLWQLRVSMLRWAGPFLTVLMIACLIATFITMAMVSSLHGELNR